MQGQISMNIQDILYSSAPRFMVYTSFYAPTIICEVHLLLSQTHTQKCPNKMKFDPSKYFY